MFEPSVSQPKSFGLGVIVLWIWVTFTSLYFLLSITYPYINSKNLQTATNNGYTNGYNTAVSAALGSFSGNAYQNGQKEGYLSAFINLGQALNAQVKEGCKQVIPVNLGTGVTLGVVNAACLQQDQAQAGAPAPAAQQAPAQ